MNGQNDEPLQPSGPPQDEGRANCIVPRHNEDFSPPLAHTHENRHIIGSKKALLRELAARFHARFAGLERAHGQYDLIQYDAPRADGKVKGKRILTVQEPITDYLWGQHLSGQHGLGIIPIREDGTCLWGAIDVDVYQGLDHAKVAAALARLKLPLIPCRSKSGGVHLYVFCTSPVSAAKMYARLQGIANQLKHPKAEIFPKQKAIAEDAFGSWINMPYFDADSTTRYAVRTDGLAMSPEEFLLEAERLTVAPEFFEQSVPDAQDNSLPDGPPCLQALMAAGFPDGTWNNGTFSLGVYCRKAHPDNWKEKLVELNSINFPPDKWPVSDLDDIIRSLSKKSYTYPCSQQPILGYCDKEVCATRKYGVGRAAKSTGEGNGIVQSLADAIMSEGNYFARDAGGRLYHFVGGVYRPRGKRFVEQRVKELCVKRASKSWTPELATRVEQYIVVDAPELWECPPLDVLNCRNGLLSVESRTLTPHSPAHLSAVQIGASFDPSAVCPQIDKFVQEVFPEDSQHLSAEVAAWLMLPDTSIQKAVLLLGDGSNGKSRWINLLLRFLGPENVSALSLHKIEADKFAASRLVGKLANLAADLPTKELQGTSMFKALTGADLISAERKFEPSFEFMPFARLVFSANSAPRSEDSTHGFFRRWLVIPFNRTFDEADKRTLTKAVIDARLSLPGELCGLLNKALDALPVIRTGRFTESDSTRAAMDEFRRTTDPFAVWLDQNTIEKPGAKVPKYELRNAYNLVCQENGRPILGDVQFTGTLKRLRPRVLAAKHRINGRLIPVFTGLGFVTQEEEQKSETGGLF